jgi:signal transduction histidine kinase
MARSAASTFPSRRARWLWPAVLIVSFLGPAAAVVPVARVDVVAAVVYGVCAVALPAVLEYLRRQHRGAVVEAARVRAQLGEREAEAVRTEARWGAHVADQAEFAREEVAHLTGERLTAALARTEVPPPLHSRDELGEGLAGELDRLLTEITASVEYREESQRLALVELASRVQTSAHRIQAAVTGVAALYPEDTDLLKATMQADHAATQQARHAQSLKVLCGEWPGQQWQKPLALVDVVRAASGRILAYQRVEVTGPPDLGIAPFAVEPLIHVLAELLANATEYSPPRTVVPVSVRSVQRGAVIEVDDGGLGLDDYRLSEAREIVSGRRLLGVGEVGEIPQTGFAVIGRFADRHGFGVDLGPSPYGGIRAVVLVPVDVLETISSVDSPAAAKAGRPPRTEPVPRPAAEPAQLPSGSSDKNDRRDTDAEGTPDGAPADTPQPTTRQHPAQASAARVAPVPPDPAQPAEPMARTGRLPQRRSVRGHHVPPAVEAAPTAVTPPGSPEQAGDWMEQFFEGARPVPSDESSASESAPSQPSPPVEPSPHKGHDGPSPTT